MSLSWYHGALPEPKANALLEKHGMADGLFLVRENRKETLVLSMAHEGRPHHIPMKKDMRRSCFFVNDAALLAKGLSDLIKQLHDPEAISLGATSIIPCALRTAIFREKPNASEAAPPIPQRTFSGGSYVAPALIFDTTTYANSIVWGSHDDAGIDRDYENDMQSSESRDNGLSFEPLHDAVDPSGRHASVSQRLPPRVGQAGAPTRPPPMLPSTLPVTDLIDALPPVPARRSTLVTPVTSRPTSRGPVSPNGDTGHDYEEPLEFPVPPVSSLPIRSSETACSILNDAIQRHVRDINREGEPITSPLFDGMFTLRMSNRRLDQAVLSVVHQGVVLHYDITQSTDGHNQLFALASKSSKTRSGVTRLFRSINELAENYRRSADVLPVRLTRYVP